MSIFIDRRTRLIVQGITGRDGSFHTRQMAEYGTAVVGGVTPGKGGQMFGEGPTRIPIYDTVADAAEQTGRQCRRDLCAAGLRGGRDHGGRRQRAFR